MFGFVKQRKAAKKNWEERQEYEHLVKVLTAEKKAARLAKEAEEAEELKLEIAAVLKKEAEAAEAQREAILQQALTPDALARLRRIKLVKPDKAKAVENTIASMAMQGRLPGQINEGKLVEMLERGAGAGAAGAKAGGGNVSIQRKKYAFDSDDDDDDDDDLL